MSDLEYDYDKFVATFFIKYGKLQIEAYHGMNKANNFLHRPIVINLTPEPVFVEIPPETPEIVTPEPSEDPDRELTDMEVALIKLKKSRTSFKNVLS